MADKKITIAIKATGADAAAREIDKLPDAIDRIPEAVEAIEEIPEAIDKIPDATPEAVDAIDNVVDAVEEIPDAMDEAGAATQRMDQNLQRITRAQTAQIIGQLSGQVGQMGAKFREVAADVAEFDEELARSLRSAADNIEGVSSSVSTLAFAFAAGGPLGAALAGLGIMLGKTGEAWIEMRSAQEQARQSALKFAEQQAFMASQQDKLRASLNNEFIAGVYKEEADQLARQVTAIERINRLRGEMDNIEQSRANRQVDIARDSGGDVALAEANALAVKLRSGLDALNGELAAAESRVAKAERLSEQTRMQYERAVNEATDPAKLAELDAAAQAASADLEQATQQLQDVTATASAKRLDFLEGIQEDFRAKEQEYAAATSNEANKAFESVYQGLKQAVATGPQAAIANIKVEVDSITTTANQRAAQVQQDSAAITQAVQSVGKAIDAQGAAMIAALASVVAGINQITGIITRQQAQIVQLFGRIR